MKLQLTRPTLILLLALSAPASAQQKNELGLLLGSEQIPGTTTSSGVPLSFGGSLVLSANYARLLRDGKTSLFFEAPFATGPNHRGGSAVPGTTTSLATLYVVPSLRVRFAEHKAVAPWLSAGFGYGFTEGSRGLNNGAVNTAVFRHTGVVQFGGGIDVRTPVKLLVPISLRFEFRDYYVLGAPFYGTPTQQTGQHDLVPAGGIVLHF